MTSNAQFAEGATTTSQDVDESKLTTTFVSTPDEPFPWLWIALGVVAVGGGYAYYKHSQKKV